MRFVVLGETDLYRADTFRFSPLIIIIFNEYF
jgi:hypothetical protein